MLYSHVSSLSLPSEIILLIVETMNYEPKLFGNLMSISKVGTFLRIVTTTGFLSQQFQTPVILKQELRDLIRANIGSLSTSFAMQFQDELKVPTRFLRLSSSEILHQPHGSLASSAHICIPSSPRVSARTLLWVEELHRRSIMTNELVSKLSKSIISTVNKFCPSLRRNAHCSRRGLQSRVEAYHRWTIHTLFRIFDARHDQYRDRRQAQEDVIKNLSVYELSSLIIMVHGTSVFYVETLPAGSSETIWRRMETNCIYRELELRYGPCLIWASLYGTDKNRNEVAEYVKSGLDELTALESSNGETIGQLIYGRSLQSVMMKEFCKKKRCNGVSEAWDAICDDVVDFVLLPRRPICKHNKATMLKER